MRLYSLAVSRLPGTALGALSCRLGGFRRLCSCWPHPRSMTHQPPLDLPKSARPMQQHEIPPKIGCNANAKSKTYWRVRETLRSSKLAKTVCWTDCTLDATAREFLHDDCNFQLIIHEAAILAPNSKANARLSNRNSAKVHQLMPTAKREQKSECSW